MQGAPNPVPKSGVSRDHSQDFDQEGEGHAEAPCPAAPPGCPFLILMMLQGRPRPPGCETGAARGLATYASGVGSGRGHWGRTQVGDEGTVLSLGARGPLLLVPQLGVVSAGNQAVTHCLLVASLRGTHRAPPLGGFSGSLGEPAEGRLLPFSFFLNLSRVRLPRGVDKRACPRNETTALKTRVLGSGGHSVFVVALREVQNVWAYF